MKRLVEKMKIGKGMPGAVLLSIFIHVGLFLLAGTLVVFTVVKKNDQNFEPPKAIERPKMKLKKPKVKIKKTTRLKPTTRIVTKIYRASMPDIQLPEMSGMGGEGFGGGIDSFDMMPDFEDSGLLGASQSIGNDFVGTFYDFTRNSQGRATIMDPSKFTRILRKFVRSGWNSKECARYYRSPKKLYATTFAIPTVHSPLAPLAFDEPETSGYCFAVHYKGQLVHKDDITFRFWGLGDDILIVRVNGEIVLSAPYPHASGGTSEISDPWQSNSAQSRRYLLGDQLSVVGDWITLEAGVPLDMEVLIGDSLGDLFQALLCVEVEGEDYERNPRNGGPVLPIFKTSPLSLDLIEAIHADLDPYQACVTNGPVFCDFEHPERTTPYYDTNDSKPSAPPLFNKSDYQEPRTWTSLDGRTMEARFRAIFAGNAVLENEKGRQLKIPIRQLSPEDHLYIDLAEPPEFTINFSKKSNLLPRRPVGPYELGSLNRPMKKYEYVFGAELEQSDTHPYPHELTIEYFVFGEEVDGDNYVLLDRQKSTFIPCKENNGSHAFYSKEPVILQVSAIRSPSLGAPMRGIKYGGFLITITNERGEIIQYKTPQDWLFENLENLKDLPIGKHFDKRCVRVGPPRPTEAERPPWL